MSKTLYDHAYTLAFSLKSNHPAGDDVTPRQLRTAILERLTTLSDDEILEAAGAPFDTYEVDPPVFDITPPPDPAAPRLSIRVDQLFNVELARQDEGLSVHVNSAHDNRPIAETWATDAQALKQENT
jgi:hypothetical protein